MAEKRSCKTMLGKSLCKRGVNDTSMVKVAGCEPTAPTPVVRYQAALYSVLYEQYALMGRRDGPPSSYPFIHGVLCIQKRVFLGAQPITKVDIHVVGVAGFEPTAPTPPAWCATRLRYTPFYINSMH